jgi:hypothetical protein
MDAGIGTVAVQFLSWEYLFRIFGTVSLQCLVMLRKGGDATGALAFTLITV